MEEQDKKGAPREEIFSRVIRAGKRTYFFDVKATRSGEQYLTITESKRRFNNEQGKFYYEKHKLFLYQEDFDKFNNGFNDVINFIRTGQIPPEPETDSPSEETKKTNFDVDFEDLGKDESSPDDDD